MSGDDFESQIASLKVMDQTGKQEQLGKNTKSRSWCWTLANYTDEEVQCIQESVKNERLGIVFLCFGKETAPTTGMKHLQGYLQLSDRKTLTWLRFIWKVGNFRTHWIPARGSSEQNVRYCSKEGDFWQWGEAQARDVSEQRHTNEFAKAVQEVSNMKQLAESFRCTYIRYYRGFQALFNELRRSQIRQQPYVEWLAGSTGCGKTRIAIQEADTLGSWWCSNETMQWFDGYEGQHTAILDDFRAAGVKFQWLLRVLDRYPLSVPIKGGFTVWDPVRIIITCPRIPQEEFVNHETGAQYEDLNQLIRRLTVIKRWNAGLQLWEILKDDRAAGAQEAQEEQE